MKLPPETVQVSFLAGQATTNASFTGTRLLHVFDAAPIRLAYSSEGQPMGDNMGMARLVVPGVFTQEAGTPDLRSTVITLPAYAVGVH